MKWTRDHKLKSVVMGSKVVKYSYDFGGKRVMKEIINGSKTIRTFYVSDASGNSIATYQDTVTISNRRFWLKENVIYGSSRLGNYIADLALTPGPSPISAAQGEGRVFVGKKQYELSNHLGNVYVTITDRKIWNGNNAMAEVLSVTDYYAYNMEILERTNVVKSYRYGLNGQEKSPELAPNHTTAEFWEYDARSGRRWNLDPEMNKFPQQSPYLTFDGNPILKSDILGNLADKYYKNGEVVKSDNKKSHNGEEAAFNFNEKTNKFEKLDVSNSTLEKLARTSLREQTGTLNDFKGTYAIASAIVNRYDFYPFDKTLEGTIDYWFKEGPKYGSKNPLLGGDEQSKVGIMGAINALSGGYDYSEGAIEWDGYDFVEKGANHVKNTSYGLKLKDEHYNQLLQIYSTNSLYKRMVPNLQNFVNYKKTAYSSYHFALVTKGAGHNEGRTLFVSSVVYGGTVFWKPNYSEEDDYDFGYGFLRGR